MASGLSKENQVNTLLYCLGEEEDDVLISTNISEESRKNYDDVLAKFDAHFKVHKNIIFETVGFNRRTQEDDESVDQFIMSLYSLAENCEFGPMKDELIWDHLVIDFKDFTLSERLQVDEMLMLDKAMKLARQKEAVREQHNILKREETTLDYIKSKRKVPRTHQQTSSEHNKCIRCGKHPRTRQNCPAKDSKCYKCGKHGHFGAVYISKTVALISEDSSYTETIETSYLNAVTEMSKPKRYWQIRVKVDGKEVSFVKDTGSEVSALAENTFKAIGSPQLHKPEKVLCGPGRHSMCLAVALSRFLTRT